MTKKAFPFQFVQNQYQNRVMSLRSVQSIMTFQDFSAFNPEIPQNSYHFYFRYGNRQSCQTVDIVGR